MAKRQFFMFLLFQQCDRIFEFYKIPQKVAQKVATAVVLLK